MEKNYRILIFIFGCLVIRSIFVLGSYKILKHNYKFLRMVMSILALWIGISFLMQYKRHKKVGAFGGPAYWHPFRLVHGVTYVVFGLLAMANVKQAYLILLLDLLIGLLVFTNNYFLKIY